MSVTLNASTASGLIATPDTSGQIELQANGVTKATVGSSGLAIGQYNPSSSLITSGTAVASTSGTSIDFTSIPSWVKRITVMFNGVSTNGSSNYLIQIGTSGGIQNTGYSGFVSANLTNVSSTAGFIITAAQAATALNDGLNIISLLNNANGTWASSGTISTTTGVTAASSSGSSKTLSGVLDRVRITTVNGTDTFDAGSINILYE